VKYQNQTSNHTYKSSHIYLEYTWNIFWFCSINVTLCNRPDMEQLAVNSAILLHVFVSCLKTTDHNLTISILEQHFVKKLTTKTKTQER